MSFYPRRVPIHQVLIENATDAARYILQDMYASPKDVEEMIRGIRSREADPEYECDYLKEGVDFYVSPAEFANILDEVYGYKKNADVAIGIGTLVSSISIGLLVYGNHRKKKKIQSLNEQLKDSTN